MQLEESLGYLFASYGFAGIVLLIFLVSTWIGLRRSGERHS